jgi:hypothetical protein
MQTLLRIWRVLSMVGLLAVPQLLGVLAYFTCRKYSDLLAHLVGVLIPPVLFFFLAQIMLSASVHEIQSGGERVCGTFVGMTVLAILFGTGVQVFLSILAQFILYTRSRPAQA